MRAMILAAGQGRRLRPLTDTIPKPLIEVAGRPMIAFPLHLLRRAGIQDVVINLHHLGTQIRSALGDGSAYGVHIEYSEENPILDTGGAIAAARAFLDGDTFVVLNADTFVDLQLADMIAFHRGQQALATLLLRPDSDAARRDDIGIDATQRVRRLLGHGDVTTTDRPLARCLYAGIMVFEPRVFTYLPEGVYSITHTTLRALLAAGEPVYGFVHSGYWRVLDTPADLAAGRREIAARFAEYDSP